MQNKCGWRFNKGHLDTWVAQQGPKKKKKNKGFILNTTYQNKFWTEFKN